MMIAYEPAFAMTLRANKFRPRHRAAMSPEFTFHQRSTPGAGRRHNGRLHFATLALATARRHAAYFTGAAELASAAASLPPAADCRHAPLA